MKQIVTLLIFLMGNSLTFGQSLEQQIDDYMDISMQRYEIPGAAVAVIQDGKTIHKKYYGMADVEKQEPVTAHTRFKLHSLSKVFVSTAIFQLIENGKLSLEDEIGSYMNELPETWKGIKIKHLLSHSSGLPDMIFFDADSEEEHKTKVFSEPIAFSAGDRFKYNQTNFWLLNRIIAKVSGSSLEQFLTNHQFNGDHNALVFAGEKGIRKRATEYFPNEEGIVAPKMYDIPEYMYGAAGIATTLDQFIAWNNALDHNKLLRVETKAGMWAPFVYQNGHDFAHGWGRGSINGELSLGFSGGTIVSLKKYLEQDITVVVLTNGYKYFPNINAIADYIGGFANPDLKDKSAVIRERLYTSFLNKSLGVAVQTYHEQRAQNSSVNLETMMNGLGYALAGRNLFDKAIAVFQLNTEEYPDSWNVWDSLGEGYEMAGDMAKAITYYKKSVTLNPENSHGLEKLKLLQEKIKGNGK
ncbi:serine hydrolase [Spongiimicrobium salis]|uniref:serine hydrolase n=1 Tax=Spongiimicrobium salis TaxID=1667022 RepID=UPI00374D035E